MSGPPAPLAGLLAVMTLMGLVWLVSLARRDASIVDIAWGPGFAALAWLYLGLAGNGLPAGETAAGTLEQAAQPSARGWLVCFLVTVWGLRLAAHIYLRSRGHGEDFRYRDMRQEWGERFVWVSLFTVFWLQGLILWVVALPLWWVQRPVAPQLGLLDGLGLLLFTTGFLFEAVGDWQLARFKADPANAGAVLDRGLWRYTRHPNYFGDAVLWWGLFLFAAAVPGGWWTLVGPLLMSFLLLRVSGVTLLERTLRETKPAYRDYEERTSAFFPLPPRTPTARTPGS